MSTQDGITNAVVRHQIFVQRFGANIGNKTAKALIEIQKLAERRLLNPDLTDFQRDRLQVIANDMQEQYRLIMGENIQDRLSELDDFAKYEAEFTKGIMQTNITGSTVLPNPEQISAAIDMARMEVGRQELGIRQIFKGFTDRAAKQVAQQISDGAILGETNQQITNRLRQLNGLHKNQAMTITRTVTNNISAIARDEVMRANEDVLEGYEWVAALDNRTTLVCASRDGKVYSFNDPDAPRPPAHFNCRSTIVPKVKPEFDLGADVETTRTARGADGAERIDSDTNYEAWLRRQPASFQDEVLGRERGKLFRGKKLKLERFVDDNGKSIPLDQLRVLDESFNNTGSTLRDVVLKDAAKEAKPPFDISKKFFAESATAKEYQDKLTKQSSERTMAAMQKALLPKITDKRGSGAVYDAWEKEINCSIDKGRGLSFIHEYGHHIDSTIGRTNPDKNKVRLFAAQHDSLFIKAFEQDKKALGLHKRTVKWDKLDEVRREMADLVVEEMVFPSGRVSKFDKWNLKNDYYTQVMDIFDAMTAGGAYESKGFAGHGTKYYKDKGNRYAETFAQLFSLDGAPDEVRSKVDKWFPNTKKRFHEILDDYIKNGVTTYDG